MRQVTVGLLGAGTVGGGVIRALRQNGGLLASRTGIACRLVKVAVRDLKKKRKPALPASLLTANWAEVVHDPEIELVVELAGGVTAARDMTLAALKAGKPVITANKALLSAHGAELFAVAQRHGVNLYYEASVAGGIPIIKVLREGLIGNEIVSIHGIVNGTCNYILTRMKLERAEFGGVLAEAQRLGYAEAEASLDIDGHDALHKMGILASLAHGFWVNPQQIHREGIRSITQLDIQFAGQLGYTIKLLGVVKKPPRPASAGATDCSRIQVSVYPALVPNSHVLASVNFEYNAILVRGDIVGDTLYYGRGAGADATASAVLSDLADAALDLKSEGKSRAATFIPHECRGAVVKIDDTVARYYVRFSVVDRPGTLAKIATLLGRAHIGISSVIQPEGHEGESVPLILMIHDAPHAAIRKALSKIAQLPVVKAAPAMIRVESFE